MWKVEEQQPTLTLAPDPGYAPFPRQQYPLAPKSLHVQVCKLGSAVFKYESQTKLCHVIIQTCKQGRLPSNPNAHLRIFLQMTWQYSPGRSSIIITALRCNRTGKDCENEKCFAVHRQFLELPCPIAHNTRLTTLGRKKTLTNNF